MHYRVHRWLAVHVIKHTHMVSVNWSLGENFPQKTACQSFGSHGNGGCKAGPSLQSLQGSLSDAVLSVNMCECFMNTKYLCACLKRYHANLSLKQGYDLGYPESIYNRSISYQP